MLAISIVKKIRKTFFTLQSFSEMKMNRRLNLSSCLGEIFKIDRLIFSKKNDKDE
jgi:hypothetical protein